MIIKLYKQLVSLIKSSMQEKLHTLKMLITSWHTKKFITTHTINMTDKTIIFTNAYQEPSVFTSIQNLP